MKSNCAEIGIIQAFIDGELSSAESDAFTAHVAACDECAVRLADAEQEAEMVFASLGRELDPLVPTQRLWSKINTAIESERRDDSVWTKVRSFFAFPLANPSMSAALGLLLVFGLAAAWFIDREPQSSTNKVETIAKVGASSEKPSAAAMPDTASETSAETPERSRLSAAESPRVTRASVPTTGEFRAEKADIRQSQPRTAVNNARPAASEFVISGEETYVKTIADMSRNSRGSSSASMRPNEMIAFERNMAIVDDSISRMRNELRKNPNNTAAKQLLRSSYENKIDLLNSVALREELVAGIN